MCFSRYREVVEQRADLGMSTNLPTPERMRRDYDKHRRRLWAQARRCCTSVNLRSLVFQTFYWEWIHEIESEVVGRREHSQDITAHIQRLRMTDSVPENSQVWGILEE